MAETAGERYSPDDDIVDLAGDDSFPASDTPAWSGAHGRLDTQGTRMAYDRLIAGLNEDLSGELGTIIRYNYQAAQAEGPVGEHIREILRREIPDELGHAAFLSEAIVDLGGEPTTTPMPFEKPETVKEMLELDLAMEEADEKRYTVHAKTADEAGLPELKLRLEEIAADEGRHARELRRILRGL